MRLRNVKNAKEILENCELLINNPQDYKGNFNKLFNNNNPICLEIGMGKGQFIIEMAKKNPNINYIGIEKMSSILARGIEKVSKEDIPNIRLLRIDALQLNDIFDKEIDTIYLNFSDPWPKNRHAKRRLTSEVFLKVYDDVFKNEKKIIQKTDNDLLFESSLVSLSEYGYILKEVCLDLHNNINISNCMTEYEEKFSKLGIKIKYLKAVKK